MRILSLFPLWKKLKSWGEKHKSIIVDMRIYVICNMIFMSVNNLTTQYDSTWSCFNTLNLVWNGLNLSIHHECLAAISKSTITYKHPFDMTNIWTSFPTSHIYPLLSSSWHLLFEWSISMPWFFLATSHLESLSFPSQLPTFPVNVDGFWSTCPAWTWHVASSTNCWRPKNSGPWILKVRI